MTRSYAVVPAVLMLCSCFRPEFSNDSPQTDAGQGGDGGSQSIVADAGTDDGGLPDAGTVGIHPQPTNGVLVFDAFTVSKGLYQCLTIRHIAADGSQHPVPTTANLVFSGAETIIRPVSGAVPCTGFPFEGVAAGTGALTATWGSATGIGTIKVRADTLTLSVAFSGNMSLSHADQVVAAVNFPVPVLVNVGSAATGFIPPGSVTYDVMPSTGVTVRQQPEVSASTALPGTYTLRAMFNGVTATSSTTLQTWDVSAVPMLDFGPVLFSNVSAGRAGSSGALITNGVATGEKLFLAGRTTCAEVAVTGQYRIDADTVVTAVIPGAQWSIANGSGEATLSGSRVCVTRPGDAILTATVPGGLAPRRNALALGTEAFVSTLLSATAMPQGNLICGQVSMIFTLADGSTLDVSGSEALAIDVRYHAPPDTKFTTFSSRSAANYCQTAGPFVTDLSTEKYFTIAATFGTIARQVIVQNP